MSSLSIHNVTDTEAVVTTDYNVAEITRAMEFAKARHNSGDHLALGDDKLVASVHPAVIHKWCADKGITFSQFMIDPKIAKRFLEDPDNSNFRIWKGRI